MKRVCAYIKSWFLAEDQHRVARLTCSLVALSISMCCFIFQPPASTETVTTVAKQADDIEQTISITRESGGTAKFCETTGLALLVLVVWLWRKELGIKGFGGLEEADVSPQPPDTPPSSDEDSAPPPKTQMQSFLDGLESETRRIQAQAILEMFTRTHSVSPHRIAAELRVSLASVKELLFTMRRAGVLRVDGFPKTTVFTLAASTENLTLDKVRDQVASGHNILSERRFVRIRHMYDIDSVLTCEDGIFIVEAKYLQGGKIPDRLDNWIIQMLRTAKEFPGKPVACILALTCKGGTDVDAVQRQVKSVSFDSGDVPVQVEVFDEDELRRGHGA